MIDKLIYANFEMILCAFLILIFQLTMINNPKINSVKIAGYILKAFQNSPLIKKIKERCKPQPRHSKPNMVLLRQGNIYSSKIIFEV